MYTTGEVARIGGILILSLLLPLIWLKRRRSETLHLAENLPRIDGAAAILPPRRYTPSPTGSRTTGTSAGWWNGCCLRKGNIL